MIDLSKVPTELIEQEYFKRKAEAKNLREKLLHERVCCRNCAYKIYGKTNFHGTKEESWVCVKHPKKINNYRKSVPWYNMAYYACRAFTNGCEMFLHKDSEEGQKVIKKNKNMSIRMAE